MRHDSSFAFCPPSLSITAEFSRLVAEGSTLDWKMMVIFSSGNAIRRFFLRLLYWVSYFFASLHEMHVFAVKDELLERM